MFCQQCEQTATETGCYQYGQCGKTPEVDAVQDLMISCLKGKKQTEHDSIPQSDNADIFSLKLLILYGLKGFTRLTYPTLKQLFSCVSPIVTPQTSYYFLFLDIIKINSRINLSFEEKI